MTIANTRWALPDMLGVPPRVRFGAHGFRLTRPRRLVLLALLADPGHDWLAAELARVAGVGSGEVYRVLGYLVSAGTVAATGGTATTRATYQLAGPDGAETIARALGIPSVVGGDPAG